MTTRTNTSTPAADRIKALASLLSEDDPDDDDCWGEKYISRDNVRERRNLFQKEHIKSPNKSPKTPAATTTARGPERRGMTAESKSKSSFKEKSSVCPAVRPTQATATTVQAAALPSKSSTNSPDNTSPHATSAVKIHREWKREQVPDPLQHRENEEENQHWEKTTPSTTNATASSVATTSTPSPPPPPQTEPQQTTQPKPTENATDSAIASTSSSALSSSSSKQIVFGRPDTFGAAGMGIATSDYDSYYMPNVKERAKALSYWKLTKKEKNGHQRALEWKRSCCGDDDCEVDGGGSVVNTQEGIGESLSYTSSGSGSGSSGGVGQAHCDRRCHEDDDGFSPNCSGGGGDSASLAAALTMKKASAPGFLAKFVQLLEDDVNDNEGREQHQYERGKMKKKPTELKGVPPHSSSLMVAQEHENTVNGGVPLTPRGSGAPSPRVIGKLLSPRAALSPRSGFVSKHSKGSVSLTFNSPSTKNAKTNKNPCNNMVTKQNRDTVPPKSPRVQVNDGSLCSIAKNETDMKIHYSTCSISNRIGVTCDDNANIQKTSYDYQIRNDYDHVMDTTRREGKERNEDTVDKWYDSNREYDVDSEDENRVAGDCDGVDDNEIHNNVEANAIQSEVEVHDSIEDDNVELDGQPKDTAMMTMNATDSVIEEAMTFLHTPLFDLDCPIEIRLETSDDDEDNHWNQPQRGQFINHEEASCEGELLEVAERFALSLDRFLVGSDDAVGRDVSLYGKTAEGGAQRSIENRTSTGTFSIGEESGESETDECAWEGWIETPLHNDGKVQNFTFPINNNCEESGKPFLAMEASESYLGANNYGGDDFGEFQLSLARNSKRSDAFFPSTVEKTTHDMPRRSSSSIDRNSNASDGARKPTKIKISIDGAPEFSSKEVHEETTFFVANQPSPSCGDDACLLVGQSSIGFPAFTAATAPGQGNMAGKQSATKLKLKRLLNNNAKSSVDIDSRLPSTAARFVTTSSSLFGPLPDDSSATNDSIRSENNCTSVCDQEMDSTGKFFIFASSATSFTSDASPQNGFVANFDNKTLCIGGSISSSSDCGDCAGVAPALATKAKKILKRMKGSTPFLGKTKKMNAFGSLDDGDIDQ